MSKANILLDEFDTKWPLIFMKLVSKRLTLSGHVLCDESALIHCYGYDVYSNILSFSSTQQDKAIETLIKEAAVFPFIVNKIISEPLSNNIFLYKIDYSCHHSNRNHLEIKITIKESLEIENTHRINGILTYKLDYLLCELLSQLNKEVSPEKLNALLFVVKNYSNFINSNHIKRWETLTLLNSMHPIVPIRETSSSAALISSLASKLDKAFEIHKACQTADILYSRLSSHTHCQIEKYAQLRFEINKLISEELDYQLTNRELAAVISSEVSQLKSQTHVLEDELASIQDIIAIANVSSDYEVKELGGFAAINERILQKITLKEDIYAIINEIRLIKIMRELEKAINVPKD